MSTTIQISNEVKKELDKMKMFDRETYNEVIERMIEDDLELNEATKRDLEEAIKEIKSGKYVTHEQVKKRFGL